MWRARGAGLSTSQARVGWEATRLLYRESLRGLSCQAVEHIEPVEPLVFVGRVATASGCRAVAGTRGPVGRGARGEDSIGTTAGGSSTGRVCVCGGMWFPRRTRQVRTGGDKLWRACGVHEADERCCVVRNKRSLRRAKKGREREWGCVQRVGAPSWRKGRTRSVWGTKGAGLLDGVSGRCRSTRL